MKLMIVGSDEVYAIENYYVKYLRESGLDVSLFPAQPMFYQYYQKRTLNKIIYRLGISNVLSYINRQLRKKVEEVKPDVIWIFKGMEIFPETIKWARSRNIRLVNYNPDNPFIFTGSGSGNANVTKTLPFYDLHLTYNLSVKEKIEKEFKIKTGFLPFGFEVCEALYQKCIQQQEVIKACFLGNPDNERAAFLLALADSGVSIDVYGNNWASYTRHANITIFPPVYADELWMILRRYRVQLNLMRVHNLDSHNMRSFEVPGVGGIMVAPDTREHRIFFEEGKMVFLFSTVNECRDKINYLLHLNPQEAATIRTAARTHSIAKGYSYKDRAKQAYDEIRQLDV